MTCCGFFRTCSFTQSCPSLTKFLKLFKANLRCFEVDTRVKKYLDSFEDEKTKVIYNDFMKVDLEEELKDLTIDKLTVNDENSDANSESAETYEEVGFADITLDFADSNNCKYLMANHTHLTSNEEGLMAVINFIVPPMGAKLVCRYLVLDLRELAEDTVVGVTWPEAPIKWLYGMPDIQAGYFYVLAFQVLHHLLQKDLYLL